MHKHTIVGSVEILQHAIGSYNSVDVPAHGVLIFKFSGLNNNVYLDISSTSMSPRNKIIRTMGIGHVLNYPCIHL